MIYNNNIDSIKLFLFFITKNLHPYISFNIVKLFNTSTHKHIPM